MSALQALHNTFSLDLTSLSFVYVFLPLFLIVWHLSPKKLKPFIMLLFSILFYAFTWPQYLPLLIASLLLDFAAVRGLYIFRRPLWRGLCLWFCVIKNIGLICYFGVLCRISLLPLPLGLFVYCVLGIGAVLESYRDAGENPPKLVYFAAYSSFFPRLYAGPLSSYADFSKKLDTAGFDSTAVLRGFGIFVGGLLKYALLGKELFGLYNALAIIPDVLQSVLSTWSLVLAFALSFYFTLSGLADLASGISHMLGIRLPQNFYYPYQSRGVTDFFGRFNMTVGEFLTRNVYATLSPQKPGAFWDCVNLILVGMLWGNWFGMRINYTIWGVFITVFIMLEKYAYPKLIKSVPTLFLRGYAVFVIIVGFSFMAGDTPIKSFGYIRYMFGFFSAIPLLNDRVLYVLSSNIGILLISILFSFNGVSLLTGFFRKNVPVFSAWILGAVDFSLLAVFTAFVLRGGAL